MSSCSHLSQNTKLIASQPELCQKIINMFNSVAIYRSVEYQIFLDNLKEDREYFKTHWDDYMKIIHEELQNNRFPQMVTDFIKMGFSDIQNSKGETLLDLIVNNGGYLENFGLKEKCENDSKSLNIDLINNEKDESESSDMDLD